ncbi:MAG: AMP-binding protein [Pseudomonadota bacterium]|nr:AMP-binding protein [Pseudomonadota bacterium]
MSRMDLLRMEETRRAAGAAVKQIGVGNIAKSLTKALVRSRFKRDDLARAFMLAFWDTLGDREAVVAGETRLSFRQFKDRVLRLANALYELGLRQDDACAELLYNGATWFELNQACSLSGYAMPMLNWHLRPKELEHCINRAQPKALVFDSEFLETVQSVRDQLTSVKHFIIVGATETPDGMIAYQDLVARSEPKLPPGKFGMAAKTYSGGTTGTPKYINIDQTAMMGEEDSGRRGASREEVARMGIMQASALGWYGLGDLHDPVTRNARSLIPGPLYHAGVQIGVLPFIFGGTVVPMRKFSPEGFLQGIQEERINWTFVAPTMLERVLGLPDEVKNKYNLSSMHTIVCAAAPCPPKVKKEINALFRRQGAKKDVFHEYYGASETGLITILVPDDYQEKADRYNSVGKVRAAQCRIYDPETQTWAPPGKEGKVLVRSALTFGLKYVGDQQKTDECYLEIDGLTWYDDGLIGYLDDDGFLYLTSRVKEMIISGGVNLFPNEIEHAIKHHPKVLDVAVVRAPDNDLGEVPAAVIQLKEGETATAEEILEHCKKEGLYGFKLPKIVEFGELPRNLAGKLPKKQLEARFWEGVETHG